MHEIRDFLFLGSVQAEAAPLSTLKESGITHIVQVGTGDFMAPKHSSALSYCCIRALDFEGEDLLTKIKAAKVHSFISEARDEGGKVLVHCFAGVSRSATTVLSYLMASEGLTFEDALVDVISKRSCIAPNRGFCDQLRILQDQCGNRLEDYRNDMIQEQHDELNVRQWLALIMRCKERANAQLLGALFDQSGDRQADAQAPGNGLTLFKQRLEERKQLASEGRYEGITPPEGAQGCEEDLAEDLPATGGAGEYSLELT